jgi:signal transduction histidine kinase
LKINIDIHNLEENWIEIQIRDNGLGISEEAIPNIFRPNFTTKSSGTGLGLAFVKQTVEGMNGRIRFETEINKGTTFFIALPLYNEIV